MINIIFRNVQNKTSKVIQKVKTIDLELIEQGIEIRTYLIFSFFIYFELSSFSIPSSTYQAEDRITNTILIVKFFQFQEMCLFPDDEYSCKKITNVIL